MPQRLNLPSACLVFTGKTGRRAGDLLTKSLLVRGLSKMQLRCKYDGFCHLSDASSSSEMSCMCTCFPVGANGPPVIVVVA